MRSGGGPTNQGEEGGAKSVADGPAPSAAKGDFGHNASGGDDASVDEADKGGSRSDECPDGGRSEVPVDQMRANGGPDQTGNHEAGRDGGESVQAESGHGETAGVF